MPKPNLTFPTGLVLQAISHGNRHGFDIVDATGLPSGTVYPDLERSRENAEFRGANHSRAPEAHRPRVREWPGGGSGAVFPHRPERNQRPLWQGG